MTFKSNYIEFNTQLSNYFSNEIIKKFNEIDINHSSNIQVILNENICIINGNTTIKSIQKFSEKFTEIYNKSNDSKKIIKVLDFVEYNKKRKNSNIFVNNKYEINLLKDYLDNKLFETTENVKANVALIPNSNKLLYTKNTDQTFLDSLDHFEKYQSSITDSFFVSDYFYGKDIMSTKTYEFFIKNICYNLVHSNICDDMEITMFFEGDIKEINNNNITLNFKSNTLKTSTTWLNSLVLDLFDFRLYSIIENFNLDKYDFGDELFFKNSPLWKQKQKVKDIIPL